MVASSRESSPLWELSSPCASENPRPPDSKRASPHPQQLAPKATYLSNPLPPSSFLPGVAF